jgi:hypothetical protein
MQMLLDRERANRLRAGRRLEYFTLGWTIFSGGASSQFPLKSHEDAR